MITFGSDAHDPTRLARDFARAADLVEAQGFRQGRLSLRLFGRAQANGTVIECGSSHPLFARPGAG